MKVWPSLKLFELEFPWGQAGLRIENFGKDAKSNSIFSWCNCYSECLFLQYLSIYLLCLWLLDSGSKNWRSASGIWWKCLCWWKESLEVSMFCSPFQGFQSNVCCFIFSPLLQIFHICELGAVVAKFSYFSVFQGDTDKAWRTSALLSSYICKSSAAWNGLWISGLPVPWFPTNFKSQCFSLLVWILYSMKIGHLQKHLVNLSDSSVCTGFWVSLFLNLSSAVMFWILALATSIVSLMDIEVRLSLFYLTRMGNSFMMWWWSEQGLRRQAGLNSPEDILPEIFINCWKVSSLFLLLLFSFFAFKWSTITFPSVEEF